MWFMNKIANPFVCWILRSPLHGLLSAGVRLILRGQTRSGRGVLLDPARDMEVIIDGLIVKLRRFSVLTKTYGVRLESDDSFNITDMHQAATSLRLIRVVLDSQ